MNKIKYLSTKLIKIKLNKLNNKALRNAAYIQSVDNQMDWKCNWDGINKKI